MKKRVTMFMSIVSLLLSLPCYGAETVDCVGSTKSILVDGRAFQVNTYNIDGYQYFKLRDVASILAESQAAFSVSWNEAENVISIIEGKEEVLAEVSTDFSTEPKKALFSSTRLSIHGQEVQLPSYSMDGYTYWKLRDLGEALGFQVEWEEGKNQIQIRTIDGTQPIYPEQYQTLLGKGMDVDWSKTKAGRETYSEKIVTDFLEAGISHVRIRIADDATEELLLALDQQIEDCIANGLIPIIAYQADDFKNKPNEKNLEKTVAWWKTVAERYQDVSYLLSFDLLIEATDQLNQQPDRLNELYEAVTTEIRKTNPERILFISPRMRSDAAYLAELEIPTDHNQYLMAEWHFYAAGPSKENERKKWTTGTEEEKQLIRDKIEAAVLWQNQTGIRTWVGAWMPGNYNDGNDYSIEEQMVFAQFVTESLEESGIPFAVNSDTKFYDRESQQWVEEMIPLRDVIFGEK